MSSNEVRQGDPRFASLVQKRFNKRFDGKPDHFHVVSSAEEVAAALDKAVREGRRVAVQSGGHCLEGFVSDPAVRVVIDTSLLSSIHFDEAAGAFSVGAGATLGEVHRKLFLGWGVMLPAGQSPDIGVGGHVLGGGFGFFHREHGLAADHLFGIEVVVVDEAGKARVVTATREPADPNRELWWAHTGCGGGNLGVVTRYLFRAPAAHGGDPTRLLPRAPEHVTTFKAEWDWKRIDAASFASLVGNYGDWCAQNSDAESPTARLFSVMIAGRPAQGPIALRGVVTADTGGMALIDGHLAAVKRGAGTPHEPEVKRHSWLDFVLNPFPDLFAIGAGGVAASPVSLKIKDALLRRRHSDRQLAVAYEYLTRKHPEVLGGSIGLAAYGGRMNTTEPDATAYAQRASVMATSYGVGWLRPEDETASLAWVRELYQDMFAETGGVPAPGDSTEGSLINHPDSDLADPSWNRSTVPWSTLYYLGNYSRLQRAKARWDPRNVFHHALSIRADG